jgi:hypothetical protein
MLTPCQIHGQIWDQIWKRLDILLSPTRPTGQIRYQVGGFVQLLFTIFLRRYFDSRVLRPI